MIPQFAMRLICGLATMWCLAPRRQITSGFFRIQMLLTLGLSVLTTVTASQIEVGRGSHADRLSLGIALAGIGLSILSFLGSVMWTLERRRAGAVFSLFVLGVAMAGVAWSAPGPLLLQSTVSADAGSVGHELSAPANIFLPLGDAFSSAWLIGSVTATMLLGHWYLTATGMPLTPLAQYNKFLCGAVVLRILFAFWTTWANWDVAVSNWPMSILRWGGVVGPLLLSGLTMRILKYRNTQSATGVLYAATILVFMGELAAVFLSAENRDSSPHRNQTTLQRSITKTDIHPHRVLLAGEVHLQEVAISATHAGEADRHQS